MSTITVEGLIDCITNASATKEVVVPGGGYYSSTDYSTETINYVDADVLVKLIERLVDK